MMINILLLFSILIEFIIVHALNITWHENEGVHDFLDQFGKEIVNSPFF